MQEGESYVVALNPADGKVVWKVDRTFPVQKESGQSYTTPYLTTIDGVETLVIWGPTVSPVTIRRRRQGSLDLRRVQSEDKAMWRVIASPGFVDGIAVVPYGRTK